MKFKKIIAVATAATALCCSCIFPATAADSAAYSKTINVKEGQVVTAKIYLDIDNPGDEFVGTGIDSIYYNSVSGITYSLLREQETLSFTDETLSAAPNEICPNFPSTMINLETPSNNARSLLGIMDVFNPYDFTNTQMLATLDLNVNKTGLTTLTSDVVEGYMVNMDPQNDSYVEQTPYCRTQLEIYIDGYALGDCDKNGRITVADAIEIQKAIAGISTLDSLTESLADTECDGRITVADAIAVQKCIAGIVDFL